VTSRTRRPPERARPPLLTSDDLYLFNEGTHSQLYERLGAHLTSVDGAPGAFFAVWAPTAAEVSVIGEFNDWTPGASPLAAREQSGLWEGFLTGVRKGSRYKFHIVSPKGRYRVDKADPVALCTEPPPATASIVWDLDYTWGDGEWMQARPRRNWLETPIAVYEVHLGSWRRVPEEGDRPLGYREIAPRLAEYVEQTGFTHVELLPIMEHPFYGSWGYQVTGYFAPTSRYGTPQDFMFLIDTLHRRGIGVILDWVPSHFPTDEHGLVFFDGTHVYEHADPRQGLHRDWNSAVFNYGRPEVRSFLLSSARLWLDRYHADALRVDAVASMLYLDYSRPDREWIPNVHGGRENLEAMAFLRALNTDVCRSHPDVQTIAEESTAWPMVTRPVYLGGLGFGFKWDMGWMHDTLDYMARDPIHRRHHHGRLTFRALYAFAENFMLALSHDEVVHGKGSLLGRMPGDEWQKFANLRLLLGYMYVQPGKKLLFMGGEFAQRREWAHDGSLDWHLLDDAPHRGVQRWVADLNRCYRSEPALHEYDCDGRGFEWIDCNDAEQSVLSMLRRARNGDLLIAVCNFTPVPRMNYRVGAPRGGVWRELLNGDARDYGGAGHGNLGAVEAVPVSRHGRSHSLTIAMPPLAVVVFKSEAHAR
jgi:1,4-alpha-glucan branching enzyme